MRNQRSSRKTSREVNGEVRHGQIDKTMHLPSIDFSRAGSRRPSLGVRLPILLPTFWTWRQFQREQLRMPS